MAELEQGEPVSLQELIVSTLAMADALTKLLIKEADSRLHSAPQGPVQGDYLNHYLARFSIAFLAN